MTEEALSGLLMTFVILAVFLLLGCLLRAKVKGIGKLCIPASVIGGVIMLLLGPEVWGSHAPLAFSQEWMDTFSVLPSVLVIPIFAAVPLGFFSGKQQKPPEDGPKGETVDSKKGSRKKKGRIAALGAGALMLYSVGYGQAIVGRSQYVIGMLTHVLYSAVNPNANLYWIFGWELERGFAGGHSTAGAVASMLQRYGWDFWELSQGVTVTTATVGLIGGMIIGIVMVNVARKKGWISGGRSVREIDGSFLSGIIKDPKEQAYQARETTHNHNIEMLTLHMAVILAASGMGMWLSDTIDKLTGAALPAYILAMMSMYLLDFIIARLKLGYLFDRKLKGRLSGLMTDFAIIAAVGSMPIRSVAVYVVPVFIMCVVGFIVTFVLVFSVFRFAIPHRDPFEHSILVWGMETGTLINGMMLLKLVDPEFESTALQDYSTSFVLVQVLQLFYTLIFTKPIMTSGSTMAYLVYSVVKLLLAILVFLVVTHLYHKHVRKETEAAAQEAN